MSRHTQDLLVRAPVTSLRLSVPFFTPIHTLGQGILTGTTSVMLDDLKSIV